MLFSKMKVRDTTMSKTNLLVKVLLCLIVPVYHTMQANIQPESNLSPVKYWVTMSGIFLSELIMERLHLSTPFTIIQFLLLFSCVAPLEDQVGFLLRMVFGFCVFQIFEPVFKISQNIFCDAMKNKMMDDMLQATQNIVKRTVECVTTFSLPVSEKSVVCHFLDFFKERSYQTSNEQTEKKSLFSDLYKILTKCEINFV